MDLDLSALLLAMAIAFGAAILKGSVGFGFPLVSVPLLAVLVGARAAIPIVALPILVLNVLLLARRPVDLAAMRRFLPIMATFIPATVAGSVLLTIVSPQVLSLVVGVVAIGFAGLTLARFRLVVAPGVERPSSLGLGLVAGLLNGSTSLPGPLFAIYLSGLRLEKRAFVYGITLLFAVGNATQVLSYWQLGLYAGSVLLLGLLLVPAGLLGQQVGFLIQDRLQPEGFRRLVVAAVAVSGANLAARGLGLL